MTLTKPHITIRNTRFEDAPAIIELSRAVYPSSQPWAEAQLASHLEVFPEGQFVAVEDGERVVGMAASLVVLWDDYDMDTDWRDFTDHGMFTNHDLLYGRTLYGAEVMVDPRKQGLGIGKRLYVARRELTERLGLLRIRAGARLRGYHKVAESMSAGQYVVRVVRGILGDPTLSFQLRRGFHVLDVVRNYLRQDPESLGYAAVIEWLNTQVARPEDYASRNPKFQKLPLDRFRPGPEFPGLSFPHPVPIAAGSISRPNGMRGASYRSGNLNVNSMGTTVSTGSPLMRLGL